MDNEPIRMKPQFQKGDLVRWKHGTDVGFVVELGRDVPHGHPDACLWPYALVHWDKGIETKVYKKHSSWHGVEVIVRAEEI